MEAAMQMAIGTNKKMTSFVQMHESSVEEIKKYEIKLASFKVELNHSDKQEKSYPRQWIR